MQIQIQWHYQSKIVSNIIPDADATYDLGSSSKTWNDVYAKGVNLTSTDSGASAGPIIDLKRDTTGADANYIGQIKFSADNDADPKYSVCKNDR